MTVTKQAILDAIVRLECEKQNGNSRNEASSKQPKADLKRSLLSRCRAIESAASDVMFDSSEVREILELVLKQVRWSTEEQNNLQSDDGGTDNDDEEIQDEELTIEERP